MKVNPKLKVNMLIPIVCFLGRKLPSLLFGWDHPCPPYPQGQAHFLLEGYEDPSALWGSWAQNQLCIWGLQRLPREREVSRHSWKEAQAALSHQPHRLHSPSCPHPPPQVCTQNIPGLCPASEMLPSASLPFPGGLSNVNRTGKMQPKRTCHFMAVLVTAFGVVKITSLNLDPWNGRQLLELLLPEEVLTV